MTDCCESAQTHIIGSAFSLVLVGGAAPESPLNEGGVPVVNTSAWGVALGLVPVSGAIIMVDGVWVSPVAPHSMKFEQADTSTWPRGSYVLRLFYTAPLPDGRVFKQDTDMTLEIKR